MKVQPVGGKPPFEQVVRDHGAMVLRVCRAVLAGEDAQDAWSETFLSALRGWPDLPAGANVEAWLVTIAHRRAVDQVRAAARRAIPTPDLPEQPDPRGIPEPLEHVWQAVRALPPRQRLAVAYHHLGGLPHTEVARLIDSTPTATRKAASDGIRSLRTTLGEHP